MSGTDRYREAARRIPAGETRTFAELAVLAGRPGSQRAAGRSIAGVADDDADVPWHRVVTAGGKLGARRGALQLARLRAEGARPCDGESVAAWVKRVRARWVADLAKRRFARASDLAVARFDALAVERVASEAAALARSFAPLGASGARPPSSASPGATKPARLPAIADLGARLARLETARVRSTLRARGWVRLPAFLRAAECAAIGACFDDEPLFERTIEMAPRGYGVGRYRYFREPAPAPIAALRAGLYERLRPLVESWTASGAADAGELCFPADIDDFFARCRAAGQLRGSSIVLVYPAGGVNHPHQDVYGPVAFPLQALIVLSERGRDFRGGAFEWIEEAAGGGERRARVPATRGDLVVFASSSRPPRVPVRHGMTLVTHGERRALGIVFHLAK